MMSFNELLQVVDEVERELPEGVEFVQCSGPEGVTSIDVAMKGPLALCGVSVDALVQAGVFQPWTYPSPLLEVRLRRTDYGSPEWRWTQIEILPEHTPELLKKILLAEAADLAR